MKTLGSQININENKNLPSHSSDQKRQRLISLSVGEEEGKQRSPGCTPPGRAGSHQLPVHVGLLSSTFARENIKNVHMLKMATNTNQNGH